MITVAYSDVLNRSAELAGRTRDKLPPSEAVMIQGYVAVDLQAVWNKALWPELIPLPLAVSPVNRQISKNEYNGPAPANSFTLNATFATPATFFTCATPTPHGLTTGGTVTITDTTGGAVGQFAIFLGTFIVTVIDANTFTCPVPDQNAAFGFNGLTGARPQEMGDILGVTTADPSRTTKYRDIPYEELNGIVLVYQDVAQCWIEYVLPRPDLMALSGSALLNYGIPARFSNYLALRASGLLLQSDGLPGGTTNLGLAEASLAAEEVRLRPADRRTRARLRPATSRSS